MNRKNTYAAILAGGSGSRMGASEKPKQFLMLGGKPIFVHTLEKIVISLAFDKVLLLCPSIWLQQTKDLINKYAEPFAKDIVVIEGGASRNDTINNAITYLCDNCDVDENTILLTHDAVRPFITSRIIKENISAALEVGACDTVIPATDTIVSSVDGNVISDIPLRSQYYQGKTPQTFNLKKLQAHAESLSQEEKEALTDACKVFVAKGDKVALVKGDTSNIKITVPQDLRFANALLGENYAK